MCEFCVKHGEGKKWYLNAKNYSDDLLSDIRRRKFVEEFFYWLDYNYRAKYNFLKSIPFKDTIMAPALRLFMRHWLLCKHWGQVVPIEDVEKILNLTNSITRIPCVCRHITTGKETRTCFLISLNPGEIGIADVVDQSFLGGPEVAKFEKVYKKWALDFMKENEQRGMIHTIWTFNTPFIGGLCNCDISSGCIAMKLYKNIAPNIFKSEYFGVISDEKCTGCKTCVKICQFSTIEFDNKSKRAKIDMKRCYGCGICRAVCKKNAIFLKERIPAFENKAKI